MRSPYDISDLTDFRSADRRLVNRPEFRIPEQEAMVVRPGHPLTKGRITKQKLFQFPHVVVELTGTEEHEKDGFMDNEGVSCRVWIERALLEFRDTSVGLAGRAAVCVPYFGAVAPMVEQTDMVATLPRRFDLWLAKFHSRVQELMAARESSGPSPPGYEHRSIGEIQDQA